MDIRASTPASPLQMYRALVGIGVVCSLLIVSAYEFTKPLIDANKAEALERAIFTVLPSAKSSRTFLLDAEAFKVAEGVPVGAKVYAGYNQDSELVGLAIEAAGMGYADTIRVLYGYTFERDAITGLVVLESKETPGLGDRIEKDPKFLKNFEALDVRLSADAQGLAHPVEAVKNGTKTQPWQVDGITGATISSKAIAGLLDVSANKWVPKVKSRRADFSGVAKEVRP